MSGFADHIWTSSDGLNLYARDYAGPGSESRLPVLCLHGLTRNSKDFAEVASRISANGRRVIVPDVRGRGRSDRDANPANYHLGTYASDVMGLMDSLGIDRAVFIGTSMGGLITMTLGLIAPDRVAAALLNDVGPELHPSGIERILGYAGKPVTIATWEDAAAYAQRTNGAAFPDYRDEEWARFARRILREDESGAPTLDYDPAIAAAVTAGPQPDLWPLFTQFASQRPVALVRGALSDLITADIAGRMKDAAPGLEVTDVPRVGHAPMLTEAEAEAAIDRFLACIP
jgi:pimeloyl-ACP methyl ester carboxylesterase